MEVADQLVVLRDGKIEQEGSPREIYEAPANDFVMGFLGPVSRVEGGLVRPHDLILSGEPVDGGTEAMVARVLHLGFEVRVELTLSGGERVTAQVTRSEADQLELSDGDIVWVRSPAPRASARCTSISRATESSGSRASRSRDAASTASHCFNWIAAHC